MPSPKKHEQQFLNALRDIFVGAKVEGDSGYINLMQIKSRYYEQGVFPRLQKDINEALKPFPDFREELFDKLYTFFQRYFSESGSIYFRYTALHQNIYEKVYTDDRDVMLFWKTHMLYYVKTDRIFVSLSVEVDEIKFFFGAANMTLKRANEKRQVVYAFRKAEADGTLVFDVGYSEKGKSTKVDDMLKAIKQAGYSITDETLDRAFRVFEKQSEVDYFINKNARAFLQEQFELWMYQYLFAGQNVWKEERLAQLQALKIIAFNVIDFISQFEDELVKVWNKPKFVRNSHYILTLDKITDPQLLKKIFAHKGMKAQIAEWQSLGMVDDKFKITLLNEKDVVGEPRHQQYKYLPLDTCHFPDLELDILAIFDDLDASIDGWLIHSENYQALNTLGKFSEKIATIFIDPPYNTGGNDFLYNDKFRHSSWVTMLENRLQLALHLLSTSGALFATIDDDEVHRLRFLADTIFGEENFIANIVWQKKQSPQNDAINFSDMHDHVLAYSRQAKINRNDIEGWQRNLLERTEEQNQRYSNPDNDTRGDWASGDLTSNKSSEERPNLYYAVKNPNNGKKVLPSKNRVWRFEKDLMNRYIEENRMWWGENGENFPRFKRFRSDVAEGIVPSTWWSREYVGDNQEARRELRQLFTNDPGENATPKPTRLIETIIKISGNTTSINLDFFSGSGTTAHAVMNLNRADGSKRKYILVEMGEHFNTIILPRVKKVAFNSKWKDGKPIFEKGESGMSHFVKYYELEQYEDALRRARYADADLFNNPYEDPYNQYVFMRDPKMLDSLELDYKKNAVHFHPEKVYKDIDLAETLSNLRGKWIKRITAEEVEFQDGERVSLNDPDWHLIKPLVWWQ